MLIITDEDVPDGVGDFLISRGHTAQRAREVFVPGAPDHVIAQGASDQGMVVVTWNTRHFKSFAKRTNSHGGLSYPRMSVLAFTCTHQ